MIIEAIIGKSALLLQTACHQTTTVHNTLDL